jgi:hypothetical protein
MKQGHVTPAGKSVLDELRLDPLFVAEAKRAIRNRMKHEKKVDAG